MMTKDEIFRLVFLLFSMLGIFSCRESKDLKQPVKPGFEAVSIPFKAMEYPIYPSGSSILFGKPVSSFSPDWEAAYVYSFQTFDAEESHRFNRLKPDALGVWNVSVSLDTDGESETLFRGVYKDKKDGFSHNFLMVVRAAETPENSVVMLHEFPGEDPRFEPFFVYQDGSVFWDEGDPRNFKYTLEKTDSGYEVSEVKTKEELRDEFEWP